ncbi:MAG TPA: hypothetical protein VGO86_18830 [Candidatus Dormibacteraeota bacterium]
MQGISGRQLSPGVDRNSPQWQQAWQCRLQYLPGAGSQTGG